MNFVFDSRSSDCSLVEFVWHTQSDQPGSFISTAESNWEMVITKQKGKTWFTVRGPETKASPAPVPEAAEFFGIAFKLGSFMPNLPVSTLVGTGINLPEANSNTFWLHGAAWQFPTFENADVFVSRLAREGLLVSDPVVEAVLQDRPHDWSIRTVRRRFLQATGLTHKTIQQIERAKEAAALLQKGKPILDVVFETGYFDQAHMTKSLKHFFGQTPTQLARADALFSSDALLLGREAV